MKPFLIPKRKFIDLIVLIIIDIVFYFLWSSFNVVMLFSLGYIWNWVASQDLSLLFENRRYRFSMLKVVTNLQSLVLKPFQKFPVWTHVIPKSVPAGLFWFLVIYFNDAEMPWWMTFIGSLTYEVSQLDAFFTKKNKEPVV